MTLRVGFFSMRHALQDSLLSRPQVMDGPPSGLAIADTGTSPDSACITENTEVRLDLIFHGSLWSLAFLFVVQTSHTAGKPCQRKFIATGMVRAVTLAPVRGRSHFWFHLPGAVVGVSPPPWRCGNCGHALFGRAVKSSWHNFSSSSF